jgi:hypothetical protein
VYLKWEIDNTIILKNIEMVNGLVNMGKSGIVATQVQGSMSGQKGGLLQDINRVYAYETRLWINQVRRNGFSIPTQKYLIELDALIKNLKAANVWQQLDRMWIFATELRGHAKISIVNPSSTLVTEFGSVIWTPLKGYTMGSTSYTNYLNLGFLPATQSVNYTLTNASIGGYTHYTSNTGVSCLIGGGDATTQIAIQPYYNFNVLDIGINQSNLSNMNGGPISSNPQIAMYVGVRKPSPTNQLYGYINGVQTNSNTAYPATYIPAPVLLGCNLGGVNRAMVSTPTNMLFVGSGNINQLAFYNAFQTFAKAVGFAV